MNAKYLMNNKGFSLLELLIASSVVALSMVTLTTFTGEFGSLNSKLNTRSQLLQTRSVIVSGVSNTKNWAKTLELANTAAAGDPSQILNPELACIRDFTACVAGTYPLTVIRQDGTTYLDSTKANLGYTAEGAQCATYGSGTPTERCIYRYELSWTPICPIGKPCVSPQISVSVQMRTSDTSATNPLNRMAQNITQMGILIDAPLFSKPIAANLPGATNSAVEYPAETETIIRPLDAIVAQPNAELVPFTTKLSRGGGMVTYKNAKEISYTPNGAFYGLDSFSYQVRDKQTHKTARGSVSMQVMTPYTWTGEASKKVGDFKSSNPQNFCGKVVDGKCDGASFPASGYGIGRHVHLVFNSVCSNCRADLDSVPGQEYVAGYEFMAHSLETTPNFSGFIKFIAPHAYFGILQGPWQKPVNILINGGTVDATAVSWLAIDGSDRGWMYQPPQLLDYAVKVNGSGKLIAGPGIGVAGAVFFGGPTNFSQSSGQFSLDALYGRNKIFWAPNVEFNDMHLAGGYGVHLSSNFTVKNDMTIQANTGDDKITNGLSPFTGEILPPPTISIKNNIVITGQGGFHCDGYGAGSCEGPVFELNGTGAQEVIGLPTASFVVNSPNAEKVSVLPSLAINKTSGKTTLSGIIGFRRNFEVKQIAQYDFSTSKLVFMNNTEFKNGTATEFNDIYDLSAWEGGMLNFHSSQINVRGNYYHYGKNWFHVIGDSTNSAKVSLYGDFYLGGAHDEAYGSPFNVLVEFVGPVDQYIRPEPGVPADSARMSMMNWQINKPAASTVYIDGEVATRGDVTVVSGHLKGMPGSALRFDWARSNVNVPGAEFDTLKIGGYVNLQGDLYTKNLEMGTQLGSAEMESNGHKIFVSNDLNLSRGSYRGNDLVLNGSGNQNVAFLDPDQAPSFQYTNLKITKASGTVNYSGTGQFNNVCNQSPMFSMNATSSLNLRNIASEDAAFQSNGAVFNYTSKTPSTVCPL